MVRSKGRKDGGRERPLTAFEDVLERAGEQAKALFPILLLLFGGDVDDVLRLEYQ